MQSRIRSRRDLEFLLYELPKTTAQYALLRGLDATCLQMCDAWF
jgi:hypothetical protein